MDYTTISEARCRIDGVPVFCLYDEIVQIGQIRPNPQNPNTHPDGQVEKMWARPAWKDLYRIKPPVDGVGDAV